MIPELTEIGFVSKAHNTKGQISCIIDERFVESLKKKDFIFLEIEGYKVPFLIVSIDITKKIIIALEGVNTPEEASKLSKFKIFVNSDLIQSKNTPQEDVGFTTFINFNLEDTEGRSLGELIDVYEQGGNYFGKVEGVSTEFLIPIHQDIIISIDDKSQTIVLDLPEGLIELY